MKSRRSILLLVVLLTPFVALAFLNGCSNSAQEDAAYDYEGDQVASGVAESDDAGFVVRTTESSKSGNDGNAPNEPNETAHVPDRMVIYNGDISIEVSDYHKAQEQIQNHVNILGGFVVQSSLHHSGSDEISGSLVVRVPQEKFYPFINELESVSTKVVERSIYGNDVTEEYVDLNSRLKSQQAVEERLLSFMAEAQNTEDLLRISSDLGRVQEEIERIKGRINYLENHVSFATISIYIREKKITVPSIQEGDPLNTWKKGQSLFMDTVNSLLSFFSAVIVFFIGFSPIIVPTLIIVFIIIKVHNKKKEKTMSED
ncbi:MAG: DUF4349 domain-containing protein [Bacillus sp. (in: Bacteria)]|nr:DUF4349 domain-containing protein [Bacillus sp. (in: firmicutes)]